MINKKTVFTVLTAVLTAGLISGCSFMTQETDTQTPTGNTLVVYTWDDEFQQVFTNYASDLIPSNISLRWAVTPDSDGAYQNALDNALSQQDSLPSNEKVDIFLINKDFASKYVNSDNTADIEGVLGLTSQDVADQYDYTKVIGTDSTGKLKAVSWQAEPGMFIYRRSIAKDVLGTDDPEEVQSALSDWDKFDAAAAKARNKGYSMLSGYDDSYNAFLGSASDPWVDASGKIQVSSSVKDWIVQTKTYTDKGYNNKSTQNDDQWFKDQGPDGKVFGFFYSPYGINYTMINSSLEIPESSGGKREKGNGIYGDWAVCQGPQAYLDGGTWIACASGSDNKELVAAIMKRLTCDKDTMKKITEETADLTNTKTGMKEIAASDYSLDFLGGQNHIAVASEAAQATKAVNLTAYDQVINYNMQTAMESYFNGSSDENAAYETFYTGVLKNYPELKK